MKLDRTRIVIRERSLTGILDLALRVWKDMFLPLWWASAPLIVPLAVINWWLLRELVDLEMTAASIWRYSWNMALLVTLEAPLATSAATLYLGQAIFDQQLRPRELLRELRRWFGLLLVIQLGFRGVMLGWFLAWRIEPYDDYTSVEFWLVGLVFAALLLRIVRPYITEVLLLERNPLRARPGAVSVSKRVSNLRRAGSNEAVGRMLITAPLAAGVLCSAWAAAWFFQGTFFNQWQPGPLLVHVVLPACMWLVAIYLMVVRFLTYLDLRIRREGWEVELQLRAGAEALRRGRMVDRAA